MVRFGTDSAALDTTVSVGGSRTGTWEVPLTAVTKLVEKPQTDDCIALVKQLLINQVPGSTGITPEG